MRPAKPVIIVHGGAGDWPSELHKRGLNGVRVAADRGFRTLSRGDSALDAVQVAVVAMEDNTVFNAGRGSSLNLVGDIETDAALMDGKTLQGAGIALLRDIKNPIKAARIVFDRTNHVLIAGVAARDIALANGLVKADLRVRKRVKAWRKGIRNLRGNRFPYLSGTSAEIIEHFLAKPSDTVGALGLDRDGNLAAACSTGGVSQASGKNWRQCDTRRRSLRGQQIGGSDSTGIGEQAMRLVISKAACDLMRRGNALSAATMTIRHATKTLGLGTGLLTLDRNGRYGVAHKTRHLCWAARTADASAEKMSGTRVKS